MVYLARDLTLERSVALKVFRPTSPEASRKFLEEARAAAALSHPNVCTIHAVDESSGISMIVMEYVAGRPLKDLLSSQPLPLAEALNIGRQVALGMAAAHSHGIVHGDLMPANIMVTPAGLAKVMDFGLAQRPRTSKANDETATWGSDAPTGISGTPAYMSPEQARGEAASAASDVFSLGLMLYEVVAGKQAIPGDNLFDVLRRIDALDPERYAAEIPEPAATIVRRALATDRTQRELTMQEIARTLDEFA
jgi:serine/threonine protein kinase